MTVERRVQSGSCKCMTVYSCVLDGIPAISITAAQGTELPAREFFLPLFAKCTDAELRRRLYHLPGTLISRLAPSDSDQQQE
jgi:hypothetical protein